MTIINRRLFRISEANHETAAALLKGAREGYPDYTGPLRIYAPMFSSRDILAVEWEYDDLQTYERIWNDFWARPEGAEFSSKWTPLEMGHSYNEFRDLLAHCEVEGAQNTIVVRYTRPIRMAPGAFDEVLAALDDTFVGGSACVRVSSPTTGWQGEQTLEIEYADMPDYLTRAADFNANPAAVAFSARVSPHLAEGGTDEMWRLL